MLNATLRAVFNWNDRHVARIQLLLMQRNPTIQNLNISREGTALLVGVISTYRNLTSSALLRLLKSAECAWKSANGVIYQTGNKDKH
jgi:hypothetical protein